MFPVFLAQLISLNCHQGNDDSTLRALFPLLFGLLLITGSGFQKVMDPVSRLVNISLHKGSQTANYDYCYDNGLGQHTENTTSGLQCQLYTQGIFSEFSREVTQLLIQLSNNEEYISYT